MYGDRDAIMGVVCWQLTLHEYGGRNDCNDHVIEYQQVVVLEGISMVSTAFGCLVGNRRGRTASGSE